MSWFTLGLLALFGFIDISANANADSSKRWNAADPEVCFDDPVGICLGMYVRILRCDHVRHS